MPEYQVIVEARLESNVDPSVAATALMEELLEFGADGAQLRRDGHRLEVHLPIEARTQADALAKGARLVARSLAGEPVDEVTARVAPPHRVPDEEGTSGPPEGGTL